MMNRSTILALAIMFSSVVIVSGTNICDNAPCEPQINAFNGENFTISLQYNPSTGFEWWTKFDPTYLSLMDSAFVSGNERSGMVGVPGTEVFTFNARNAGNTEVIMLLLKPWENGTIAERKIFPINIVSTIAELPTASTTALAATPKEVIYKNESAMETPTQAVHQTRVDESEIGYLKPTF